MCHHSDYTRDMDATGRTALHDLLLSLFDNHALRIFVARLDPALPAHLPDIVVPQVQFVDRAIDALHDRGLLCSSTFAALIESLPLRHKDIEQVAARFPDRSPPHRSPGYSDPHSLFDRDA